MSGGLEPAEKTVKSDAHIYVIKFEMKVATIIRNRKRGISHCNRESGGVVKIA